MTSSNYDVINSKIAISLKVCNLSLPNLDQRCISPIPNFFRKKILKKLMTSAKISNFRILPIFADVIIFFKKFFLKKLGISELYLWSKFGKDKLHTFRDIAILRFMTS